MPFLQLLFVAKFPASFDWPNVFSFVVFTHSIGLRRKKKEKMTKTFRSVRMLS